MNHPFDLNLTELKTLDLEFEESLLADEATQVSGSLSILTRSGNEQGGYDPRPKPIPPKPICPNDPPIATTLALGEEGGWCPPPYTTLALGEEGGGYSLD